MVSPQASRLLHGCCMIKNATTFDHRAPNTNHNRRSFLARRPGTLFLLEVVILHLDYLQRIERLPHHAGNQSGHNRRSSSVLHRWPHLTQSFEAWCQGEVSCRKKVGGARCAADRTQLMRLARAVGASCKVCNGLGQVSHDVCISI